MTPTAMDPPDERDAHLRAALLHAPDAELNAPRHVSAQIIAAAHRAAGEARVGRPAPSDSAGRVNVPWWLAWWHAKPARWGASGALASVLLAGVLALLWQRAPPPGPAREQTAAVDAAPPAAPVPAARPAAAAPPSPPDAAAPVEPRTATLRLRPPPAPAPQAALPHQAAETAPPPLDAAPALALAVAPPAAPVAAAAAAQQAPDAATARAAAPPAPSPPPAGNRGERERTAGLARHSAPAMAAMATGAMKAPPAPSLQAWLHAQPGALQWQLDGAAPMPAATAWLQALALLADGRWQPAAAQPQATDAVTVVQLVAANTPLARLALGPAQVLWCDGVARCWRAALPPDAAAELLRTLPR